MAAHGDHAMPHAVLRLAERHGLELTHAIAGAIALDIIGSVDGEKRAALLLRRCPWRNTEEWLVHAFDKDLRIVWHPARAVIVTVLP